MEDLNDLMFFAKVVEHRSYSEASRQLAIPKSKLSRRIAKLEERLGVRLLQRTSRSLTLTAVGQLFYERCQAVVSMGEAASDVVRLAVAQPLGAVRVSCPITLAQFWLTTLLPDFMKTFPGVKLTLLVTNRRVDPVEEQVDLALRVRRAPFHDSSLVVRRLGQTTDVLVASPELLSLSGMPESPMDLRGWATLALPASGDRHVWELLRGSEVVEAAHEPRLICDDMFALRQAAIEGVGIALLPTLICDSELRRGLLRRVLPDWGCTASEIQATFPTRRGMLPAVRALIDYLAAHPPAAPTARDA
jgi:DNA-binding transcriptional LysR family regulator